MKSLTDGIEKLLRSIWADEDQHGGLLSRDTIRCADELRALLAEERRRQGMSEPADPDVPRQPRGAL